MELPGPLADALQALDQALGALEGTVARSSETEAARLEVLVGANAEVGRRLDGLAAELRAIAAREPAPAADAAPG